MTLAGAAQYLWGLINMVMNVPIPVFEYTVTPWNMFNFVSGGVLLYGFIMAKYERGV